MVNLKFVEDDGTERVISGQVGQSVMEAAIWNNVPGIEAICGGAMACSTCLVQLSKAWYDALPAPSPGELELISAHIHSTGQSRLSCQLRVSEAMDGIELKMPPAQE